MAGIKSFIKRDSVPFHILKWGYQPVKGARYAAHAVQNHFRLRRFMSEYDKAAFRGWQIGCGPFPIEGWLNSDIPPNDKMDAAIDITKPIAMRDDYLDVIYGSEVIEHIPLAAARQFLREAYRVLKPGGVIRLTTPDMEGICKEYLSRRESGYFARVSETWLDGEFSPEIWVNAMFRYWGHQFVYSEDALRRELESAGFSNVKRAEPQKTLSKYSQLNGRDRNPEADPETLKFLYRGTLIMEAQKAG